MHALTRCVVNKLYPMIGGPLCRKFYFLLCLGVNLQLTTINYAQKIIIRPGGHVHPVYPLATPVSLRFFS